MTKLIVAFRNFATELKKAYTKHKIISHIFILIIYTTRSMIHISCTIQQHAYVQITINKLYYDPQGTVGLHDLRTLVRSLTSKQS